MDFAAERSGAHYISELCIFLIQWARGMEELLCSSCLGTRSVAKATSDSDVVRAESSSGSWALGWQSRSRVLCFISLCLWQSSECFSLIHQTWVLQIPLLYIFLISFPQHLKFQNADPFRAGRKLFWFMRMKVRYSHLYVTSFNCSLKRNKLLVVGINFSPCRQWFCAKAKEMSKASKSTCSAGILLLLTCTFLTLLLRIHVSCFRRAKWRETIQKIFPWWKWLTCPLHRVPQCHIWMLRTVICFCVLSSSGMTFLDSLWCARVVSRTAQMWLFGDLWFFQLKSI